MSFFNPTQTGQRKITSSRPAATVSRNVFHPLGEFAQMRFVVTCEWSAKQARIMQHHTARISLSFAISGREKFAKKHTQEWFSRQRKAPDLSPGLYKLETASLFRNETSGRPERHGTESQPWRGSPNQMCERRRQNSAPEASEQPRSTRFRPQDRHTNK